MSGVNDIRSSFLDYFANNGHEIVASSQNKRAQAKARQDMKGRIVEIQFGWLSKLLEGDPWHVWWHT